MSAAEPEAATSHVQLTNFDGRAKRSALKASLLSVLSTLQIDLNVQHTAFAQDKVGDEVLSWNGYKIVTKLEKELVMAIESAIACKEDAILRLSGIEADAFMCFLQEMIDHHVVSRARSINLLLELAIKSNMTPSTLEVQGISNRSEFPIYGGGFGDVWRASLGDRVVALKTPRVGTFDSVKLHKNLCREVLLWRQLRHPHLLEFIGLYKQSQLPAIVSPWMENGSVLPFLKVTPFAKRLILLQHIAKALDYLHRHEPPIVHQDVRCANILVNSNNEAVLADFGLSRLDNDMFNNFASTVDDGCLRWRAPELMFPDDGVARPSAASDMWAYGMLALEMFTEAKPFSDTAMDPAVVIDIYHHRLPRRPGENEVKGRGLTDRVWKFVQRCWSKDPGARPTSKEAAIQLREDDELSLFCGRTRKSRSRTPSRLSQKL